jgi:hypothetical protein
MEVVRTVRAIEPTDSAEDSMLEEDLRLELLVTAEKYAN